MSQSYFSTAPFESKLVPGVKFTLRKISQGRRVDLGMQLASVEAKAAELERERQPLLDKIKEAEDAAAIEPCSCDHAEDQHLAETKRCTVADCECRKPVIDREDQERINALDVKQFFLVQNEFTPIYIRWGVKKIEGLEIDEQPATVESLIEAGPEPLVNEVRNEIVRLTRMTAEEALSFKSPTTSDAQVGTATNNSSAPGAKS